MKKSIFLWVCALTVCAGCATGPANPRPASESPPRVRQGYTAADVAFMQGMIGHHEQALVMTGLIPTRTSRQDFALMAERIDISQRSEIALMKRWLEKRGEELPAEDAHEHAAMGHGTLMPGMLTVEELEALRNAKDVAFERRFLQGMIKHHQGAILMVDQLTANPAAGREPELFIFANDVSADQSAEIKRMRALLALLGG